MPTFARANQELMRQTIDVMTSKQIGQVKKLVRYPVNSMTGFEIDEAEFGWHGLVGDRRYGVRLVENNSGFPWLAASKLPELLRYHPCDFDETNSELLPTRVKTPSGEMLEIEGDRLREEIEAQIGDAVEKIKLKHGIFDDAPVSVIASSTISQLCELGGVESDSRRFRANILVDLDNRAPFAEDKWLGHVIVFGTGKTAPAIHVTKRDVRCKMIGLDPDTAQHKSSLVKATVALNDNNAGVYGTVVCTGTINSGDPVFLMGQ